MIEVYAFLAMFTVQILAMSVLQPVLFVRYCRMQVMSIPAERLAQFYPGVDVGLAQERFLTRYRALSTAIAVLGLLVLGWLVSYMRRPDWDESTAVVLVGVYFGVQVLPLAFAIWFGVRFNRAHKRSVPERKRKAILQRRGLFDFISPFTAVAALLGYVLFAAFVIYAHRYPTAFDGSVKPSLGYALLGTLTLVYVLEALCVYAIIFSKKANPFATHADRGRAIGLAVKSCVYACIACVGFFSLTFTFVLLDLDKWQPFALSAFLVISTLLSVIGLTAPPREPVAHPLPGT